MFNFVFKPNVEELKVKGDIHGLIKALRYGDFDVRVKAAEALGNIGDKRAVEPLMDTLKDENRDVRKEAEKALLKLHAPAVTALIGAIER